MANSITFQFTDAQVQNFERLLDEFNTTMKRIENNQPQRQERMAKLEAEIELLLTQARDEVKRIRELRARQPKMLWEN